MSSAKSWANVVVPRLNGEVAATPVAPAPVPANKTNSTANGVAKRGEKVKNANNHRTAPSNSNTATSKEDSHHHPHQMRHQNSYRPEAGKSSHHQLHHLPPSGPPPQAQQQQGEEMNGDEDLEGFETVVSRKKKTVQLNNGHPRFRNSDRFGDRYSSSRRSRTTVIDDHVPHEASKTALDKCMPPPPVIRNQSVANGSICSESSSSSSVDGGHVASVTSDENELTSTTTSNGTESAGEQDGDAEDGKPKFVAAPAPKVNPWQVNANAASVIANKAVTTPRPGGDKSSATTSTTALSNNNVPAKNAALAVADPASNRFKGRKLPPTATASNGTGNRITDSFNKASNADEENWPALGEARPPSVNATAPPLSSNNVHTPEPKLDSFASSATESADSGDDSPRRNGLNPEKWPSISATDSQATMTKIMDTEVVVESTSHPNQVIARIEITDKADTDANPADGVNVTEDGANDSENAAGDESTTKKNKKAARPKWVPLPLPEAAKPRSPRRDVRPADKSKTKSAEGDPSSPVQPRPLSRGRPQRGGLNFPRGGRGVRATGRFFPKDPNDPRSQSHRDDYTDYPPEFTTLSPAYNMNEFIMPYVTHAFGSAGFIASPIGVPMMEPVSFVPAEDNVLVKLVKKQIEYYFSEENLEKDFFLRRKMDAEGFLPVRLISSFHRVKNMTQDYGLVLTAIRSSNELELKEDMSCVRTTVNPKKWPILDTVVPPPPVPSHPTMMMPVSSGFGIPLPKVNSQSENGDPLNPDVQEFVPKTNAATPDTIQNGIDSHGINGFAKEGTNGERYTGAGGEKLNGVKEEKTDVGGSASLQTTLLNPN